MRNLLKRRRLVFLWVLFVRKGGGILNDSSIHGQLTNYKGNREKSMRGGQNGCLRRGVQVVSLTQRKYRDTEKRKNKTRINTESTEAECTEDTEKRETEWAR